jgi:ribosome-binding factor A
MAQHHTSRGAGPSQRQLRVGELIRRRLSELLARDELHDPDLGRMSITVGEVVLSPDLRHATVHVMPLGGADLPVALAALERNRGTLRKLLGRALALKSTPDLRFRADETFDRMDATRRLFADEAVRRDVATGDPDEA